jgi:transcriptional regulator with XRE-family HTH domain
VNTFGASAKSWKLLLRRPANGEAEEAGLHRNHVGLLERGQRMPSILVAQQLADALDMTMSGLLKMVERESA